MSFEGKKALVTGASQGIGRVIAKTLAAEGAEVIVNCAHSPAKAQTVADEIIAAGGKASVFVCDVSDEASVKQMFARLSPIHYLINNARVDPYFRKPEMSNGDWFSLVMDINLKGAYLCSMSFFTKMTCAPTFTSKSTVVGRLLSGKSPSMVPFRLTTSPGNCCRCWSLI